MYTEIPRAFILGGWREDREETHIKTHDSSSQGANKPGSLHKASGESSPGGGNCLKRH